MNYLPLVVTTLISTCPAEVIKLWEGEVPFAKKEKAEQVITEKRPGEFRVTEVTDPHLNVHLANPETHNGKALIICPGGGYIHLAHLLCGSEVATHFCEKGFTCFVLHYQVPQNRKGALSDAMQAVDVVRSRAKEWKLNSTQIGMVGFSAGGHLVAATSAQSIDVSKRPDFAMILYGAYLNVKGESKISPEFKSLAETPPFFLFVAADDKNWVRGSLVFGEALTKEKLPFELHVVPEGGHGFGLKEDNPAGKSWPDLALRWIENLPE